MPQIIDISYFQKANELNIPLAQEFIVANPSLETPSQSQLLTNFCVKIEKSILVNALGLATYNELQLALADINNPLNAKYKKLVQGEEYDAKIWNGLDYDYSLIAFAILEHFLTFTNEQLSGIGTVQQNPESASLKSPAYKIASANANFLQGYQNGFLDQPFIYNDGEFIDWFGNNEEIEVSLYQYLLDKKADFTDVNLEKFKIYNSQNSWGI